MLYISRTSQTPGGGLAPLMLSQHLLLSCDMNDYYDLWHIDGRVII